MNLPSLLRGRWLPALLATLMAFVALEAGAQLPTKPGKYGRTLIADVVLPPSQIDKIAAFLETVRAANHGAQNSVAFGDTVDWIGDTMVAAPAASPYTMVVSVNGTATAAGDVVTTWKSGWKMDDGSTKQMLMQGLSAFDVKPGQHLTMTAAAPPTRFDRDKSVAPILSLVDVRNATIDHVQVQVWSGLANPGMLDYILAYRYLLIGVVMLAVVLVFRRL